MQVKEYGDYFPFFNHIYMNRQLALVVYSNDFITTYN